MGTAKLATDLSLVLCSLLFDEDGINIIDFTVDALVCTCAFARVLIQPVNARGPVEAWIGRALVDI